MRVIKFLHLFFGLLAASVAVSNAYAQEEHFQYGDLWYFIKDDVEAVVTYHIGEDFEGNYNYLDQNVVIPDTIIAKNEEGDDVPYPVKGIDQNAFLNNGTIDTIIIPATITVLGDNCFYLMSHLQGFRVDAANQYFAAKDGVLYTYGYLQLLYYPKLLNEEGTLRIPDETTYIAMNAANGSGIRELICGENLQEIDENAFAYCYSLQKVVFNSNLRSIKERAFLDCEDLTGTIQLPALLNDIYATAFAKTKVDTFRIDESNEQFASVDGVLMDKAKKKILLFPGGRTEYTFPDDITTIGTYAFRNSNLQGKITLPPHASVIEQGAFEGCESVTDLTLNAELTRIDDYGFWYCSGLQSITCMATTPPECGYYAWGGVNHSIPLYVPEEAVEDYKAADGWKDFNVQAIVHTASEVTPANEGKDREEASKHLRNGQLFILRDGKTYNAQGMVITDCCARPHTAE